MIKRICVFCSLLLAVGNGEGMNTFSNVTVYEPNGEISYHPMLENKSFIVTRKFAKELPKYLKSDLLVNIEKCNGGFCMSIVDVKKQSMMSAILISLFLSFYSTESRIDDKDFGYVLFPIEFLPIILRVLDNQYVLEMGICGLGPCTIAGHISVLSKGGALLLASRPLGKSMDCCEVDQEDCDIDMR